MGGVQTKKGWLLVQGNLGRGGMAETAMAETTSADVAEAMAEATSADGIVGWRMGNAWGGDGCAVEVVD